MIRAPWEILVSVIVSSALYGILVFIGGIVTHNALAWHLAIVMFAAIYAQGSLALFALYHNLPRAFEFIAWVATVFIGALAGSVLFAGNSLLF